LTCIHPLATGLKAGSRGALSRSGLSTSQNIFLKLPLQVQCVSNSFRKENKIMKIVAFEIESWERDAFAILGEEHTLILLETKLTAANAKDYADADVISTFIFSNLDQNVLQKFDHLKMIATRSTGFDHIALDYCNQQGITICNVPSYGDNTVAEHVFGLLLAISHNIVEAADRTRRGDFSLKGLVGFDLQGKTLGVIGTGSIGQCVIRIAKGFGMHVIGYDVRPDEKLAQALDFVYLSMEELLSRSDIITLHVPANDKTYHLISDKEFDQMKEGMVLINTARGSVVHIQALARALADGKVAAAGLDVLPDEPTIREEYELLHSFFREKHDLETLLAGHILLRLRNVIITPHNAFYTQEAIGRITDTTLMNIRAFAAGEAINVVNNT
jgi:D-lactate dehydrogenase